MTRLNFGGRNQTLTFQSHVGRLQQRGLISYTIPKLFDSDKWKLIYTVFYDNSLDVATFTSQRLEGKIDLRQQIGNSGVEPGTRPGPSSITYRFDFRRVKASDFAKEFTPGEIAVLSLPARVGGPGFTFIRDKRDNPLESTKGNYFTLDGFTASGFLRFRSRFRPPAGPEFDLPGIWRKGKAGTPVRLCPFHHHRTGAAVPRHQGTCRPALALLNPTPMSRLATGISSHPPAGTILRRWRQLPSRLRVKSGRSSRSRSSGFPVGGTALFVNNLELRFPPVSLPFLGEGFGFAIFHDMGNVFTAPHDMLKGLLRWHQPSTQQCLSSGTTTSQYCTAFSNSGYDYTSHAVGVGVRYKTPIGPLRFDFGYNLNPTRYFQTVHDDGSGHRDTRRPSLETQRLRHFNVFFSIGQPF